MMADPFEVKGKPPTEVKNSPHIPRISNTYLQSC